MKHVSGLLAARSALFVAILLSGAVASAQPTPAPGPASTTVVPVEPEPADTTAVPVTPVVEAPVEPRKEGSPAVAVSYDKGVVLESEDGSFETRISLRTQFRFELIRPLEDSSEFETHFVIPRGRLQFEGHLFGKDTRYKLEAGLEERGSFSFVKDLWLEQQAGSVVVRAGQWKRPFNRQELVSDFASEFNERAITAEFVGGGRDLGLAVHNNYEKSPEGIEWAVGVFNKLNGGADKPNLGTTCTADAMGVITCVNGTPTNVAANDVGPALVGHIGYNKGNIKGYSEGDLEGGPLRFAIGASYKVDLADGAGSDELSHGVALDALFKVNGFDLQLGLYLMKLKTEDAGLGGLIQAGYFVVPRKVEVCGRFAFVRDEDNFDEAGAALDSKRVELEARAGVNYHFKGHQWKIASDAGMLVATGHDDAGVKDDPDIQVRSMAQLTF